MKKSIWVFRVITMLAFLLLSALLVYGKLLRFMRRLFPALHPLLLFCVFTFVLILLVHCFRSIRSAAPYITKCIGAYGMGCFITLTMSAALTLLLPLPEPVNGWLMLGCAALLAGYGFYHARHIRVKRYTAPILKRPFRLVLISDVHLGAVGSEERLPELIERINAEEPDLVCIAGDLIDNSYEAIRDLERAAGLLGSIKSRCGVYACLGNHDAGESVLDMQRFMAQAGIHVLREEYAVLDSVQLLGRLDAKPHGGYGGEQRQATEALLAVRPQPELPLLVLDHDPGAISQYDGRASLLLCGHTHNGQIFPGSLVIRAINICGYGYYRRDEHSPHVVVSSGAGAWGPPLRIGTDCEIAVIELGT